MEIGYCDGSLVCRQVTRPKVPGSGRIGLDRHQAGIQLAGLDGAVTEAAEDSARLLAAIHRMPPFASAAPQRFTGVCAHVLRIGSFWIAPRTSGAH